MHHPCMHPCMQVCVLYSYVDGGVHEPSQYSSFYLSILYYSDDGIVISISIWQCLLEFFTNCLINGCLFIFKEHNFNLLTFLLIGTYCLNYTILPSFYLLADSRFRNSFYQKGGFKSIWSALKQNYERNSTEFEMKVKNTVSPTDHVEDKVENEIPPEALDDTPKDDPEPIEETTEAGQDNPSDAEE